MLFFNILLFLQATLVTWTTPTTHDFGDISQGKPVLVEFGFKNTGLTTISVDNVRPSCGCTAVKWPESLIQPDSSGIISIEFNAEKEGGFYKEIKVYFSGRRKAEKLYIEGFVYK